MVSSLLTAICEESLSFAPAPIYGELKSSEYSFQASQKGGNGSVELLKRVSSKHDSFVIDKCGVSKMACVCNGELF